MDFFIQDPDEARLSPEDVRVCKLQVTPQPAGNRLKVYLELTPFTKRPNIEVFITTPTGKEAAHTNILETMVNRMEFTMHLHTLESGGSYTAEAIIYYQKLPEPSETPIDLPLPEPMIVDRRSATFILPTIEAYE